MAHETDSDAVIEAPRAADVPQPATRSKWYRWRRDGTALATYLLDSEVHTFAFSVAANAILSFIPFIVLLYTLAWPVFHSQMMVKVVNDMVNYFLPSNQDFVARNLAFVASRQGVQLFSLIMILVACTGIFLPLEVALNQAWGVTKSRNYLHNQVIAFGLAILMLALGMGSILLNAAARDVLTLVLVHNTNIRFIDLVLLFYLLAIAQSQSSLEACTAHLRLHGSDLAGGQVSLRSRASAYPSGRSLRIVPSLGGPLVLGLYLGVDSLCGSAVQRGTARGEEKLASQKVNAGGSVIPCRTVTAA